MRKVVTILGCSASLAFAAPFALGQDRSGIPDQPAEQATQPTRTQVPAATQPTRTQVPQVTQPTRTEAPQATPDYVLPVPTVMRPAEDGTVDGNLVVTVQVPVGVIAHQYTLEAAYLDPASNQWIFPGTISPDFSGDQIAITTIPAEVREKFSATATRWKLHSRVTDPPGSWGPWREFNWHTSATVRQSAAPATANPLDSTSEWASAGRPERAIATQLLSGSRLQVWDGKPMPAANQRVYVAGPVSLDWAQANLTWWFRVSTASKTAVPGKGRWEMSRAPFPDWAAWTPEPGFGFAGSTDGVQFTIDLGPFAPRPPGWVSSASTAIQPKGGAAIAGPEPYSPQSLPGPSMKRDVPNDLVPASRTGPRDFDPTLGNLPVATSLFVRVVPLDAAGKDADLPSNSVELQFGPARKPPLFDVTPNWPKVKIVSTRPVRAYSWDWECWVVASRDQTIVTTKIAKGTKLDTCHPPDTDWAENAVDAIGSFADLLKDAINWASGFYKDLKTKFISTLVDIIPGCSGSKACKYAIKTGLEAGMAAVGMPPELPDFDQLQAMGEGYLVEVMAEQAAATGVPFAQDAAEAGLKEMIAQGKAAATSGGAGSPMWVPDKEKQYAPLLVNLLLSNSSQTKTPTAYLKLAEVGGNRYQGRTLTVPALDPGQTLKVSVTLTPTVDPKAWMNLRPSTHEQMLAAAETAPRAMTSAGPPESTLISQTESNTKKYAQAKAALDTWRQKYTTGSLVLRGDLSLPPLGYKAGAAQNSCIAYQPGGCLAQ